MVAASSTRELWERFRRAAARVVRALRDAGGAWPPAMPPVVAASLETPW